MQGQTSQITWQPADGDHVQPDQYYRAQWKAYAFRRNTALFFLYTWPFIAVGLFYLSRMILHVPFFFLTIIFLWLAAAVTLVWWAGEFRCPRCRRRYGALGHRKGDVNFTRGIFDKVCSNCKLRKFEHVS